MIARLTFALLLIIAGSLHACRGTRNPGSMDLQLVTRSQWNALEPRPYKQHVPVRITIHHEGTKLDVSADAGKKINSIQRWGMGPDRNWTDIPYHFLISPGGIIYEGRNVYTVGETNTEYDPTGHLLICCLGNLEEQPVTNEQLNSLVNTIAWAAKKYNISTDSIRSHKDYSKITNCPGKNLYAYLQNGYIVEAVKRTMKQ